MRFVSAVLMGLGFAGCGVEEADVADGSAVEEVRVSLSDVADLGDGEVITLVLDDDVVYTLEDGVPLDRLVVLTDDDQVPLPEILGDLGDDVAGELILGADVAMSALAGSIGGAAGGGGCWWVYIQGEGWVRYCMA